jgi:hypothetical protein
VADVRWIVCRDVCVPGKAAIGLSLDQIASPGAGQWAGLIARARDLAPRPAPTSWRATLHDEAEAFSVSIFVDGRAERGTFFPIDESPVGHETVGKGLPDDTRADDPDPARHDHHSCSRRSCSVWSVSRNPSSLRQPRCAASMVATSIFFIGIIASKTRFASRPRAAGASVSARG